MTTTKTVAAALVTTATIILLSHTANVGGTSASCGKPSEYPNFRYDVDSVLQGLVEGTSPGNPSFLYYPDGATVGTALGKANCYTSSVKDCSQCLQIAKGDLIDCNYYTYGQFDDGTCAMQYWQIGA
ncbi:hypothetical protein LINGRAHAP2_LOCUS33723 [Linum grandiflorum]